MSTSVASAEGKRSREQFSSRWIFLLAAMGSAIGLGNIWRFPYIAYENGGGAFIIPYLVALLTAGIPLLFFDYAIGHRFNGSPPLAFRRMKSWTESLGWWHVLICWFIGIYYAAILAWAAMYIWFSATEAWAGDANGFFFNDYLEMADTPALGFDFVPSVLWPMVIVWIAILVVLALGVRRGIGMASVIAIPILIIMFFILVGISLTLDGAATGLNGLFSPTWEALLEPGVWVAAYGQIFFSLSVGFGIMITYSSYLKRRTNLTGSGLVVGFSNSAFEILAGIGVFSVLGFMAQAQGVRIDEVVESGIGLAFVAFPEIISQIPGGLAPVLGILFFGSLLFAGFTSMISILEVVISGVKDKTGWSRPFVVGTVGVAAALVSILFFSTTSGLHMLDVTDNFINKFGIVAASLVATILIAWIARRLGGMVEHLNMVSSFRLGPIYKVLISVVLPIVLGVTLVLDLTDTIKNGYGGLPGWFVGVFGWGMVIGVVVVAIILGRLPWPKNSALYAEHSANEIPLPSAPAEELVGVGAESAGAGHGKHAAPPNPYENNAGGEGA